MDVNSRNQLFLEGRIDRQDLWPKITEYESSSATFRFDLGLKDLPQEPGLLLIRGPRQFGKSTWLELSLRDTLEDFGKGSAFYLNGDSILDPELFQEQLLRLEELFPKKTKVKRIFIDEVTSIKQWEKVLKRLVDAGRLRDVLIVTTGSKASDLRRGAEKLPGRKGKLARTEYYLLGVSYKDFYTQYRRELGRITPLVYLLSGGSPVLLRELWQFEKVPEYFVELVRDWVTGDIVSSGRNRIFLSSLMKSIFNFGGSPVGFHKLAKESGLANNTVAAGYIEQLSDIFAVLPSLQWDNNKKIPLARKPCKFHFNNLAIALAFSKEQFRYTQEFEDSDPTQRSKWYEWTVAQEIFRRRAILGLNP
jgi:predicted AAA+ superfamily ATPase